MRPFSWGLRREPSSHPCPASPPHSPDSVSPMRGRLWPAPNPGKPDPGPLGPGYTGSMGSSPYRLPGANPLGQHPAPCGPAAGRLRRAVGPEGCPGVWPRWYISNPSCVRVDARPRPALPACARPRAEPPQALTPNVLSHGAARCSWGLALIPDHPAASSTCAAIPRLPRVPGPQSGYCFLTETPGEPLPRVLQAPGQPCPPPTARLPRGRVLSPAPAWRALASPSRQAHSAPSPPGHPAIPAKDLQPWVQPASSSPPVSRGNPTS